ncbi:MAG: hypothetical protein R3B09_31210 [Nannocystaceae bacterium]
MAQRDDDLVYVYTFINEYGVELHCGLTNNPTRREREHRARFDEPNGSLRVEEGPMPRWKARDWERDNGCSPYGEVPSRERDSGLGEVLVAGLLVAGATALGVGLLKALSSR